MSGPTRTSSIPCPSRPMEAERLGGVHPPSLSWAPSATGQAACDPVERRPYKPALTAEAGGARVIKPNARKPALSSGPVIEERPRLHQPAELTPRRPRRPEARRATGGGSCRSSCADGGGL